MLPGASVLPGGAPVLASQMMFGATCDGTLIMLLKHVRLARHGRLVRLARLQSVLRLQGVPIVLNVLNVLIARRVPFVGLLGGCEFGSAQCVNGVSPSGAGAERDCISPPPPPSSRGRTIVV
jgi:hypothetical protein